MLHRTMHRMREENYNKNDLHEIQDFNYISFQSMFPLLELSESVELN